MNFHSLRATGGGYSAGGWIQWPEDPDFSFQFLRALGAAQDGASTISECFLAASRIKAGDRDSWHLEWKKLGDVNRSRAETAEADGHVETAKSAWLRATNYYRSAEFFLDPGDPRRIPTFDLVERCSHRYLDLISPKGEIIQIPHEDGTHLDAYFLPTPHGGARKPAVIAFGGLDEFKDELIEEMARYALPRGFSLLLVDLPGQGGTLRRQGLIARPDTEVPVSRCVDYLLTRSDVDQARIGLYGASLGGYYSARAASFEHRLACAVVDGAQWKLAWGAARLRPNSITAMLCKWVFGCTTIDELAERAKIFDLEPVAQQIKCPLLIVHGQHDEWGIDIATALYQHTRAHGVPVELKIFSEEETGASHCQVDNPTIGQELICDWLADKLVAKAPASKP